MHCNGFPMSELKKCTITAQAFPDISNLYNGDLARAFGGAASSSQVGDLVRATLQQLDRAVSVTTKEEWFPGILEILKFWVYTEYKMVIWKVKICKKIRIALLWINFLLWV